MLNSKTKCYVVSDMPDETFASKLCTLEKKVCEIG